MLATTLREHSPMPGFRIGDGARRGRLVSLVVDGAAVPAHEGETVAAALLAAGLLPLRASPRRGEPRGAFCFMGICQECVVWRDRRLVQACLVPVSDGLAIATAAPHAE